MEAIEADLRARHRSLLVLATGLGKTVVGGEVIRRHLKAYPGSQVLVLAHTKELVEQLEKAIWQHLDKTVPTQILTGDSKTTASTASPWPRSTRRWAWSAPGGARA